MNNRKKFTASLGGPNSIKVFDAETGSLTRTIQTTGEIVGVPVVVGSEMTVTVKEGSSMYIRYYTLPSGSLNRSTPTY